MSNAILTCETALIWSVSAAAAIDGKITASEWQAAQAVFTATPMLTQSPAAWQIAHDDCLALLASGDDFQNVLTLIADALTTPILRHCAYALAVEFIIRNHRIAPEEMRYLEKLAAHLAIDKLTQAIIEQAARYRFMRP